MSRIIAELRRRYEVHVGHDRYAVTGETTGIEWSFDKAFHTDEDASAYAERISEDYRHVRVVDNNEGDK